MRLSHITLPMFTAMFLTACAPLPADSFGNEARPFGTDEGHPASYRVVEREVDTREALIVQCHDWRADDWYAYVSRDGLNCVRIEDNPRANTEDVWCEVLHVKGQPQDTGWVNAICSRMWIPGEI